MKRDASALSLLARYSLPPNSLGFCGKNTAPEKFKKCIILGQCAGVKKEIRHFIVLNPYLNTLAKILSRDKFSRAVIESYWFGSSHLKKVKDSDYELLLKNFKKQGVPEGLLAELMVNPPRKFVPTHLFQVLHVGVGRSSGSVPFNLKSINNCMIRWGRVESIGREKLKVCLNSLVKKGGSYGLIKRTEWVSYISDLLPGLKMGDTVSVHWGLANKKLTGSEEAKLTFWTNNVLQNVF